MIFTKIDNLPTDILNTIVFYSVDRGSIYKTICLISKIFYNISYNLFPNAPITFSNELIRLLEKYPEKNWNWERLSANPNITLEYIDKHPTSDKYRWNWLGISSNPNITIEFVEKYYNSNKYRWDWGELSHYLPITLKIFEKYISSWNYFRLSHNCSITIEIISKYKSLGWDWEVISCNPNITMKIVEEYKNLPWSWEAFSWNPNITMDFIKKHPENNKITYNYNYISCNPGITMDIVESYRDEVDMQYRNNELSVIWDWDGLSENPNLTSEFIIKYSDKLNWMKLLYNKALKLDVIENLMNSELRHKLNFDKLSRNPNITIEFVEKYYDGIMCIYFWDWAALSFYLKLTDELIEKYKDKLSICNLSYNPSVTLELVEKYLYGFEKNKIGECWNWNALSHNLFSRNKLRLW